MLDHFQINQYWSTAFKLESDKDEVVVELGLLNLRRPRSSQGYDEVKNFHLHNASV